MKTSVTLLLVSAALAGCAASPSPNYDARFGDALRQARARMLIDPNAGRNPDPVVGIDGRAAHEALGRYHESFKSPPPVTNVINIGGAIGGSGGGN